MPPYFAVLHHSQVVYVPNFPIHACFLFEFTCCHTPMRKRPVSFAVLLMPTPFSTAKCSVKAKKNQDLCTSSGHYHHHVCPVALLSVHADTLLSTPYAPTKWCRRQHMTQWWCNNGFQHCRLPILYSTVCILYVVQYNLV